MQAVSYIVQTYYNSMSAADILERTVVITAAGVAGGVFELAHIARTFIFGIGASQGACENRFESLPSHA